MPLHVSSTVVLIVRRSKLYYTASVIITPIDGRPVHLSQPVHGTAIYRCSGVPRNFVPGGGSTNSVEDRGQRERGSGGGSSLVRGSGGSCNLVQEMCMYVVRC